MTAEVTENDLLTTTTPEVDQTNIHPLLLLQREIAAMPDVDADRVQAVLHKIRSGALEILGTEEEQLASALRIAKLIIDESSNKPE